MKKITLAILTAVMLLCGLCSCQLSDILGGLGTGGGNTGPAYNLLVTSENATALDVAEIRAAIFNLTGDITVVADTDPAKDGEIVFGDADRDVTEAAKEKLEAEIGKSTAEVGYIIYADGKSIAVYWNNDELKAMAIHAFLTKIVDTAKLEVEEGILASACYTMRALRSESEWFELSQAADPEVYNALKELSAYYDGAVILGWLANLWDNDVGAFYFSASARDNEPFRPDIESTNQALGWLSNNNVLKDQNTLPNDIKLKLVTFAKSLQSETDGYFYHPQWPQGRDKLQVDRYGRDLSWASSIITRFTVDTDGDGTEEQQYPNWCTPSGVKCELHKDGGSCSFATATTNAGIGLSTPVLASSRAITVGINDSAVSAVSRVKNSSQVIAVASAKPDYSSPEAFVAWLEATNTNIKEHSGNAQIINAQQDMIIGNGYCDELLDFLDRIQEEVYDEQSRNEETCTGLWQYYDDYHAVWGLLKYTPFYNDNVYGRELKYAEEIVRTCLRVIMLPADGRFQANDIYNQWQGMQALFNNVKKHNPKKLDSLYEIVRENAADYISNSIAKLEYFKSPEGAFAFLSTGRSSTTLYGTPVSNGEYEGDVNATVLLCSMYRCMFSCLGYDVIHLASPDDLDGFLYTIRNLEPVSKNELPTPTTIDFESDEALLGGGKLGNLSGGATLLNTEKSYKISGVVTAEGDNNVLQFNSKVSAASYGDGLTFDTTGLVGENCIVFESDICVASASINDIIQIRIGDFYRLRLNKSGSGIRIYEMLETSGAVTPKTVTTSLKMGEWFRLRIECYKSDDNLEAPRFKIFINGQHVLTSENYYGINGNNANETASTVLFRAYKSAENEIYFDNCFFHVQHKYFDPDNHTLTDARDAEE